MKQLTSAGSPQQTSVFKVRVAFDPSPTSNKWLSLFVCLLPQFVASREPIRDANIYPSLLFDLAVSVPAGKTILRVATYSRQPSCSHQPTGSVPIANHLVKWKLRACSEQLWLVVTVALRSFANVWSFARGGGSPNVSHRSNSLKPEHSLQASKSKVPLRPTVRQTVSLSWCQTPSGDQGKIFVTVRQLLVCQRGAPSLTRWRVCHLPVIVSSTCHLY
jgi:hypothetical protein